MSDDPVDILSLELGADPNIGMRTERAWQRVRRELEQHRARRDAVLTLHRPSSERGQGWNSDHTEYGDITPACRACGTADEYAVAWPVPDGPCARGAVLMCTGTEHLTPAARELVGAASSARSRPPWPASTAVSRATSSSGPSTADLSPTMRPGPKWTTDGLCRPSPEEPEGRHRVAPGPHEHLTGEPGRSTSAGRTLHPEPPNNTNRRDH